MSLIRYEPWSLVRRVRSDLDRMFETSGATREASASWYPAVDIREEAQRFVLRADLPGLSPEDIAIAVEDCILTLKGERELDQREADEGYRRVERISGRFERRFTRRSGVDSPQGFGFRARNRPVETPESCPSDSVFAGFCHHNILCRRYID